MNRIAFCGKISSSKWPTEGVAKNCELDHSLCQLAIENGRTLKREIDLPVIVYRQTKANFSTEGIPSAALHCSTRYNFVTRAAPSSSSRSSTIVLSLLWQGRRETIQFLQCGDRKWIWEMLEQLLSSSSSTLPQCSLSGIHLRGGTPRSIQFSRVAHRFSPNLHMTTIWQRLENQSYCLVDKKKKIR